MKERIFQWFVRMQRPQMARRLPALFIAVILMGFGVAVFDMVIGFGTDPCSTMNLGIARTIGMPFGTAQLLINLFMLLAVIRFDADRIGIGTLANMILVGYAAEFFMWILGMFPALAGLSLAARFALFVPVQLLFMTAAAVYMVADMGVAPYDAIPQIIARKKGWSFRLVRIAWDTFMMTGGYLLGSTVGLVTMVIAFGMGPLVTYMAKKLHPYFN
ncbi:MAG: hypothetical protein IJ381_04940 [Clostridia bacterium]|nr:hypothetical protein [Clostridia bacterium]